jgi:predicted secreted protein
MATHTGKDGRVSIAGSIVSQIKSWSVEQSAEPIDASVIGAVYRNFKPGLNGWTASIEGYYDMSDAGQAELQIGEQVAVLLLPAVGSGERQYSGLAFITTLSETASFDGMVEYSASLQGNGDLTSSTQ